MSSTIQRSSKPGRQSLFFRDIASPISAHRGKFATPGQAAAVSALWKENFGGSDPPPPPVFTLDDRADFSPESGLGDLPPSSEFKWEARTPTSMVGSPSPLKYKGEASTSTGGVQMLQQQSPGNSSWWSPAKSSGRDHDEKGKGSPVSGPGNSSWWSPAKSSVRDHDEKGKGSPVDGVVQPGALVVLPPPREVVRPELQRNSLPRGDLDEEEWVTVYGFSPGDTNLMLREFEKCGVILKHVPGPRDANWMHILYQNRYDAQKALGKNGMLINSVLLIGVKPMDPMQRQFLNEKFNSKSQGGFNVSLPLLPAIGRSMAAVSPLKASPRPYYLQSSTTASSDSGRRSTRAIASPAKSVFSKVMDLMFGI